MRDNKDKFRNDRTLIICMAWYPVVAKMSKLIDQRRSFAEDTMPTKLLNVRENLFNHDS